MTSSQAEPHLIGILLREHRGVNMKNTAVKKFAGVAGKTVKFIESASEEGRPLVFVQFTGGTALHISLESTSNTRAKWLRVRNGNHSPLRRKALI